MFVIGCVVLTIYFKVNFYEERWAYYGWVFLLCFGIILWGLCMIVTIKNTPLGFFVTTGLIMDLLCLCEAHYENVLRQQEGEEEGCCACLKHCC